MNRYKVSLIRRGKNKEDTFIMMGTSVEDIARKAKRHTSAKTILYIQLLNN